MSRLSRAVPKRPVLLLLLTCFVLALAGCSYIGYYTRQKTWHAVYENKPSMSVLKRFAPGDSLLLDGKIVEVRERREPLLLVAVSNQYKPNEIVAVTTLREPVDEYRIFLPKGDYTLFVFADLNGNGWFERNELVGQASGPSLIRTTLMRERLSRARRSWSTSTTPGRPCSGST